MLKRCWTVIKSAYITAKEIFKNPRKHGIELVLVMLTFIIAFWAVSGYYLEKNEPSYIKEVMLIAESGELNKEEMSAKQHSLLELERERMNRRYDERQLIIKLIGQC